MSRSSWIARHDWLLRFLEHRIGDARILRLIRKWLKAGIMENCTVAQAEAGTPQGAVIAPLLANSLLPSICTTSSTCGHSSGLSGASPSLTQGGSPVRESRTLVVDSHARIQLVRA